MALEPVDHYFVVLDKFRKSQLQKILHYALLMNLVLKFDLGCQKRSGKISAQPHTIVKQICFPNGNVLFLSLFSLFKN